MLTKFVFVQLLRAFARKYLSKAEREAFEHKLHYMRLRDLKDTFWEHWEEFSERYREIKDRISGEETPSALLRKFVPGGIDSKPVLFEYFAQHWYEVRPDILSEYYGDGWWETVDPGVWAIDGGFDLDVTGSAVAAGFDLGADPEAAGGFFDTAVEFVKGLFGG